MYIVAWIIASSINSSTITSSVVLLLLLSPLSLLAKSSSVSALLIGLISIILYYLTSLRAISLLYMIMRIDLWGYCGRYIMSGYKFPLSILFICPSWVIFRVSIRKLILSILSSIRIHFPFLLSSSQLYTSWNILAVRFYCPNILI
jgi:hypothetical protein